MNKKGFTLIELLAVIVVLAIVMVLAITTVLPLLEDAREQAFRTEATNTIKRAEQATAKFTLGQIPLTTASTSSCKSSDGNTLCFTIQELVNLGFYDINTNTFKGKVVINITDIKHPTYKLWFKKGAEYSIVEGSEKDYSKNGTIVKPTDWAATTYEACSCS